MSDHSARFMMPRKDQIAAGKGKTTKRLHIYRKEAAGCSIFGSHVVAPGLEL